jgi:DNA repair protein RadA/Sms
MKMMSKNKSMFECENCGYTTGKYMGRCPNCNEWNTFKEVISNTKGKKVFNSSTRMSIKEWAFKSGEDRITLGLQEFDRVFGGGITRGSVNLIGGEPGVGKSTLMLEVANSFSKKGMKSLYISGEESPSQVSMRANRLGTTGNNIELAFETDLELIIDMVAESKPEILFIDSVQILTIGEGIPGSPSIVREATRRIVELAKKSSITTFLIGHVTKEGTIAGPKTLEHLVDAVSYLNGDKYSTMRILVGVKNRFGPTNEIGIMEMTEQGLIPADNNQLLSIEPRPGVATTAVSMGNRLLALEVQALLSPTYFPNPRRVVTGCNANRVMMILAVIEKRCNLPIGKHDVFVNVVGGISSDEPSIDLPIAVAIVSSFLNKTVPKGVAFAGEIGLTGEIRQVSKLGMKLRELIKLGQETLITPEQKLGGFECGDAKIVKATSVGDVLSLVWPRLNQPS